MGSCDFHEELMSKGTEKLKKDLAILERFSAEMHLYLPSDMLFYPTGPNIPQLTLGGYLMRQHRLLLLRDLLDSAEQNRLDHAISQAQSVFSQLIVRFEHHAHEELEARFRQWNEYLRDVSRNAAEYADYYESSVEPRVMIKAIVDQFRLPPYELKSTIPDRIKALDQALYARWRTGDFIWPEEWEGAYPVTEFWWLYGLPG
jgi:hypothetical protein